MTGSFEPEHGPHALIESAFFINFKPEIEEEKLLAILENKELLTDVFPVREPLKKIEFRISPDGGQLASPTVAGAEFKDLDDQKNLRWLLRLSTESLSIHCLDYSRWDEVFVRVKSILSILCRDLQVDAHFSSFGLKNIDKFRYSNDIDDYQFSDLFDPGNTHIAPHLQSAGPFWHCHTGWFEEALIEGAPNDTIMRILNQVNIGSATENEEDEKVLFCKIEHNLIVQLQSEPAMFAENSLQWVAQGFDILHKRNKSMLIDILVSRMAKRISLLQEE